MTRAEILDALCRMSQGQFDRVAATLVVPFEYLPGANAAQASRAVDMVRYLEAEGRLEECEALFDEMKSRTGRPEMVSIGTDVNQAAVAIEITRIKWRGLIIIALIFMFGSALIVCLGLVGLYFLIGVSGTTALVLRHKARQADRTTSLGNTTVTDGGTFAGTDRSLAFKTYRLALFIASVGGILAGILLGAVVSENLVTESSARISSSIQNSTTPTALLPPPTSTPHPAPSTRPTTVLAPENPTSPPAPSSKPTTVPAPENLTSPPGPSSKPKILPPAEIPTSSAARSAKPASLRPREIFTPHPAPSTSSMRSIAPVISTSHVAPGGMSPGH